MNSKMGMSQSQSMLQSLTVKQRIFVGVLMLLSLVLSFAVVCWSDEALPLSQNSQSADSALFSSLAPSFLSELSARGTSAPPVPGK
jgi:hypothetical protein